VSHSDYGFDQAGDEVAIGQDDDGVNDRSIKTWRLSDGRVRVEVPSERQSWVQHTSARGYQRPGWALLSAYAAEPLSSYDTFPNWQELLAVQLDGSGTVERWAQTHYSATVDYNRSTFGVPSPDGTRVMFASDWEDGSPSAQVHTYVVEHPRALGDQLYAEGIDAVTDLDGSEPAPVPFTSGATYVARGVERLEGGGMRASGAGNDIEAIDAGAGIDWPHEITFRFVASSTRLVVNFAGVGAANAGGSPDADAQGYALVMSRESTSAAWDAHLERHDGGGAPPVVLTMLEGAAASAIENVSIVVVATATEIVATLLPSRGENRSLRATDDAYRGMFVGTETATASGGEPAIRTARYGVRCGDPYASCPRADD
jgi:hypothetical protein